MLCDYRVDDFAIKIFILVDGNVAEADGMA